MHLPYTCGKGDRQAGSLLCGVNTKGERKMQTLRELTDKELDAVCGGGWFSIRTGSVFAVQVGVVNHSFASDVSQNINTGLQLSF